MIQIANQQETIQTLKGKLATIYEYLINKDDTENAEKIKQLAKKLENQEFIIAFCGHFSAGKSTMINQVIGENLLPSSPIPTSANLVKVRSGEEYAKVFFKDEKPRVYLAPYDYELVKKYCKNGDQIKEIEISHLDSKLPHNTIIMDTPGIDSADDAHRIATESALHLADLVFYVMDYNHVQSELNFLFTKQLVKAGKEVFLVINQIDKHKEEELSFQQFQKSVIDSFASWGVIPAKIFYTSMKIKNQKYNQFEDLQDLIWEKLTKKDDTLIQSVFHSLKKITEDHLAYLTKENEKELIPVREILNELSENEEKSLYQTYDRMKKELQASESRVREEEHHFEDETNQILKNAYLMPFQTRALAEAYIESRQPGFKVGLLFGGKKTEKERQERLHRFYQDLLEKIKSQLEWHLREFFLRVLKGSNLNDPEILDVAQSFLISFPINIIEDTVKPGARLSGEYVLNYTEQLANEIKKLARKFTNEFREFFLQLLKEKLARLDEKNKTELKKLEKFVHAFEELERCKTEFILAQKQLEEILNQNEIAAKYVFQLLVNEMEEFEVVPGGTIHKNEMEDENTPSLVRDEDIAETQIASDSLKSVAKRLKNASQLIYSLPGFNKLASELEEKAARLENKGFTVALFGAFSAGKSSFANALIGEKVLPVSPNPTTAAINQIKPVDKEHPHGTVLVKFKEPNDLLEEINRSLKPFDLSTKDFSDAINKIEEIKLQKGQEGENIHFSFLKAFKNGYKNAENVLGKVLETNIHHFSDYVANEEKSCFVEWIELYYDCELTRKGITLVDTPGADSINARHTGVAFEYIKNSDAILFVTYYNHAFSKADREFLIQLGRVKDSFHLDKMFFIINAVDLAETAEEKELVVEYVKEQLVKYGIRNPHLYPLSSMLALQEKQLEEENSSGMKPFETAFYPFITNDLTDLVKASAENEWQRVNELIEKLIRNTNEDKAHKEEKRALLHAQENQIEGILKKQNPVNLQKRFSQEASELVFYIKQRVFLRFGDFFKEAFNPTLLRDDGRNLKRALQTALNEFLESFGYDFAQEMRATTIRLDRFSEKVMREHHSALMESIQEINQDLSFSIFEYKNKGDIQFEQAFKNIDKQLFQKAMSYFKTPKSFFEKNEKKLMSEELYQLLSSSADQYLQTELERVKKYYGESYQSEFSRMVDQMKGQLEDQLLSLSLALKGEVSLDQLLAIKKKLREMD